MKKIFDMGKNLWRDELKIETLMPIPHGPDFIPDEDITRAQMIAMFAVPSEYFEGHCQSGIVSHD